MPDVLQYAEAWANAGKIVICAALDGDYLRRPFGKILGLLPLAESITKLTAVCTICGADAAFTKRLGSETSVELIGGADMYTSCCRTCWSLPPAAFAAAAAREAPVKGPARLTLGASAAAGGAAVAFSRLEMSSSPMASHCVDPPRTG